jgi:hypothetical protein
MKNLDEEHVPSEGEEEDDDEEEEEEEGEADVVEEKKKEANDAGVQPGCGVSPQGGAGGCGGTAVCEARRHVGRSGPAAHGVGDGGLPCPGFIGDGRGRRWCGRGRGGWVLPGAPCFSSIRRLSLSVHYRELDDLARLLRLLRNLPMLEHVEMWGDAPFDLRRQHWWLTGGRQALLELEGVLGGLERGRSVEEVRMRVHKVMYGRYGCLRG